MNTGSTQPAFRVERPDWLATALARVNPHDDEARMQLAVALSRENVQHGGGPFAALIFDSAGRIAGAGVNFVISGGSSILHAEILAILEAQASAGRYVLPDGHAMFTSCEPCAMCLGAVQWSGLRRVVWAATRDDATRAGFDEGPVFDASHDYLRDRGIILEPGPCRAEARAIIADYSAAGGIIYNP